VETPDKHTAVLRFDGINPGIFDALDVLYIIDNWKTVRELYGLSSRITESQ